MNRQAFCDYYDFLGIPFDATQNEIYTAWKYNKNLYRPSCVELNQFFSNSEIEDLARLTDEAYGVLSHSVKRAAYNELLARRLPERYRSVSVTKEVSKEIRSIVETENKLDGTKLKKLREDSSCSIEELSQITKIKTTYLEALEANEIDQLPAPVFVRGYVAQICKVFQLNEKSVCQSYMNYFNEQSP